MEISGFHATDFLEHFVAWSCDGFILTCLECRSSLFLPHLLILCLVLTFFLYFYRFSIFSSPPAAKARGSVPRGSGVCLCACVRVCVYVCVRERKFKRLWICRSVWERKIVRHGDSVRKGIVCVFVCVPLLLRLSNWDMGSVCAVHKPFWCKSHMSIAVNLDNSIKLVELVWDFSLQCVHAHSHTHTHSHTHKHTHI